ncbi:MAG: hypothetical protein ACJASR_001838, partial [Psychroserpens sp.]
MINIFKFTLKTDYELASVAFTVAVHMNYNCSTRSLVKNNFSKKSHFL